MRVTGVPREVSFMAHVQTAHRPTGRRARRILGPLVSQTSVRGCGTGPPGRGPRGRVAGAGAVHGFAASVGLPCRVWTGRGRASQVSAHLYLLRVSRRLPHTPGPTLRAPDRHFRPRAPWWAVDTHGSVSPVHENSPSPWSAGVALAHARDRGKHILQWWLCQNFIRLYVGAWQLSRLRWECRTRSRKWA